MQQNKTVLGLRHLIEKHNEELLKFTTPLPQYVTSKARNQLTSSQSGWPNCCTTLTSKNLDTSGNSPVAGCCTNIPRLISPKTTCSEILACLQVPLLVEILQMQVGPCCCKAETPGTLTKWKRVYRKAAQLEDEASSSSQRGLTDSPWLLSQNSGRWKS